MCAAVIRSRPLVLASAAAAALLCNYWALEGLLADRTNFDGSWISDLSTRSEGSGPIFVALGVASGLAVCAYALVLLSGPLGERRPWLRRGLRALLAAGAMIVLASAAPLSCAEGLEANCELQQDGLDVVHALATGGEIIATVLAFALVGLGLRRARGCPSFGHSDERTTTKGRSEERTTTLRAVGTFTLVLGAVWLAFTIVTGISYLSHGVDELKGAFQRVDQLVFGGWLLALAWAVLRDQGGSAPDGE
ncbi:MAG TPA: DUF998 domain-containing protein [Solirubrobacterales bacterium]|nr:DUF998 domain-containing protein [Solirubrobacterales bacterium]